MCPVVSLWKAESSSYDFFWCDITLLFHNPQYTRFSIKFFMCCYTTKNETKNNPAHSFNTWRLEYKSVFCILFMQQCFVGGCIEHNVSNTYWLLKICCRRKTIYVVKNDCLLKCKQQNYHLKLY